MEKYYKLQNGSDVRGVAMEGVAGEEVNLTSEIAYYISASFVEFIKNKTNKAVDELYISVGHDSRLSAPTLKQAVLQGIKDSGAHAIDCGLASTPSMFMSCVLEPLMYDGAMMITASHLPFNRNGIKFFAKSGGLEKEDIKTLLTSASQLDGKSLNNAQFDVITCDLIKYYSANLRNIICKETNSLEQDLPLKGLHIVVDASNGAGGFFATEVLAKLGADISGSINLEPDGTFPNHVPNPENKQAMEAIKQATLANHADLGIIFDTDVDRAASVFANGKEINKNALIAFMGIMVARSNPNSIVVTDSVTSDHLTKFLEDKLNLVHHRFKRGYRNVINESIRLNEEGKTSCLAIETSGHGALKENYFLDDGAYMSVKMVCELVRCRKENVTMESLIADLVEAKEASEYRFTINSDDFKTYGQQVLSDFEAFVAEVEAFEVVKPNYEGVRVRINSEHAHGWLLLRMSLHDPILPMNIECDEEGGLQAVVDMIKPFFSSYELLDITCLK